MDKLREQLTSQGKDANLVLSSAAQSGYLFGILAALKDELIMNWLVEQSTVVDAVTDDVKLAAKKEEATNE